MKRPLMPHNQALLDYIKAHQLIGTANLFACFDGAGESAPAFSKRLHYLKNQGWLITAGRSTRAVWQVSSERPAPRPLRADVEPSSEPAQLVPPRQFDVMRAPTYVPSAGPTPRTGSQDFARCPSLNMGLRS